MATRPKDSNSVVGKDKKTTPSSSTTKRTPITSTSSREKSTTSSDKNGPNSLKPKVTSQGSQIPKLTVKPNNDPSSNGKPIRRKSLDKPIPPSGAQIKKQPSPSRQQKSLASPGPRERSTTPKKSIRPVKSVIVTTTSKSISSDKTPHLRSISNVKSVAKKSVSSTKKVVGSTKIGRSGEEISIEKVDNVENSEEDLNEAIDEEKEEIVNVIDIDQQNIALDNLSDIEFFDDQIQVQDEDNYHHDYKVDEYNDQIQVQDEDNNEKIISTISISEEQEKKEEEVKEEQVQEKIEEEAEEEQEKIEDEEEKQEENIEIEEEEEKQQNTIKENDDNKNEDGDEENISTTNQEEEDDNNNNLELNQSTIEEAKVDEIKEEENHNVEEEAALMEMEENKVKELETNNHEDKATQQVKEENKEKVELSPSSTSQGAMMHGKKEAQVSNGVIEETANKLLEARKNKVRALASAFQSVIDYQSK